MTRARRRPRTAEPATQGSTQRDGSTQLGAVIEQPAPDDGGAMPGYGRGRRLHQQPQSRWRTARSELDVDVTNTSPVAWKSGGQGGVGLQLWYRWYNDEGRVVYEAPGNDYFPNNLRSGTTKTIPVLVRQPPLLNGAQRDRLRLRFDIFDSESLTWFADRGNKPVEQPVVVNHGLSGNLGLERFWQYEQLGDRRRGQRAGQRQQREPDVALLALGHARSRHRDPGRPHLQLARGALRLPRRGERVPQHLRGCCASDPGSTCTPTRPTPSTVSRGATCGSSTATARSTSSRARSTPTASSDGPSRRA